MIFLCILCFFCNSLAVTGAGFEGLLNMIERAKANTTSHIVTNFMRTVTQGGPALLPLSPTNFNAFIYRNYSSRWIARHIDTSQINPYYGNNVPYTEWNKTNGKPLTPAFFQDLSSPFDALPPFIEFHEGMSERLGSTNLPPHESLGFKKYYPDESSCTYLKGFNPDSFFSGHQIILHGKTVFPIVGISFFDQQYKESSKAKYKKLIPQNWLTPLEQALIMNSREEYVSQLALLKEWCNYSRFALGFIPRGENIVASVGLANPQWSPSDLFVSKGTPIEFQAGGAVQFYIYSVSNMHWVDIDVLHGDTLRVAEALLKLGIINANECKIMADFRDLWAQLV
jgi:hypothetical protein